MRTQHTGVSHSKAPYAGEMATVLDVKLHELGWGYQRFLREYAQVGARLGYRNVSISAKQFSRWRAGTTESMPRPPAPDILTEMFCCPVAALFAQAPVVPGTTINEEDSDVRRRNVLRLALAGAGLSIAAAGEVLESSRRSMDAVLETHRVSPTTLQRWDLAADEYAAAYQITPPQEILPEVVADFAEIQHLLDGPQPIRIRASLCRSAARLGIMAAICLSALGAHREARAWLHTARLAAEESEDQTLVGCVLARTAIVTLYYGSPERALADATTAVALLGKDASAASARAHIVVARAMARGGHPDRAVMTVLERATDLQAQLTPAERADTAFGYTDRQFSWHVANALTIMGRSDEALPMQVRALDAYSPNEKLDPALIRLDMAMGTLRSGDADEAAKAATAVWNQLPAGHRTGMVVSYIAGLLNQVPRTATAVPAVRELRQLTAGAVQNRTRPRDS